MSKKSVIIYMLIKSIFCFIIDLLIYYFIKKYYSINFQNNYFLIFFLINITLLNNYLIDLFFYQSPNHYIGITCYLLFLIFILFNRSTLNDYSISKNNYLGKWLPLIFDNPIIFINLIGNFILFIPLGMIEKKIVLKHELRKKIIFIILILNLFIIINLELLQYLFKKGTFDYIDIILNYIGSICGYFLLRK